jgi:hypothetical protein
MRPIPFLGLALVAAVVAVPALAQAPNLPTLNQAGNGLQAAKGYHLNPKYNWKICTPQPDKTCPALPGVVFSWSDKTDHPQSVTFNPVAGTLKGGFCANDDTAGGCNVLKATCTASGCSNVVSNL